MSHTDDEVRRLLQVAANPALRLPMTVAALHLASMDRRGRKMSREEMDLRNQAGQLGVGIKVEFDDRLLNGASLQDLTDFLEEAASEVVADVMERFGDEVGGEVVRLSELAGSTTDDDSATGSEVDRYIALAEGL